MASTKRMAQRAEDPPNTIIAAATVIDFKSNDFVRIKPADRTWQRELYDLYDSKVGEYRYAVDWVGRMLSKATLHVTQTKGGSKKRLTDGPAVLYLNGLFGNADGRAEMLRMVGIHLTIAGECYIIGTNKKVRGKKIDQWRVVASTKITSRANKVYVDSKEVATAEGQPFVMRLWMPHPEKEGESISPSKAALPVLRELHKLSEYTEAQLDSRLASAGILLMPDTMQVPKPPQVNGQEATEVVNASTAEQLSTLIQQIASIAIQDRASASAMVPIVITAPADAIEKVQHLTFWTPLDAQIKEQRRDALDRLAVTMDMPPEALKGSADSNHWNAWQSDESGIKIHAEPLLRSITTSFATGFLYGLLEKNPQTRDEVDTYGIEADTSELRARPNRSKEAIELYNLGELSAVALLRETGFDVEDAMKEPERKTWILRKIASGSATPEQVQAALAILGIDLGIAPPTSEPREARPDPSLLEHPERGIPPRERSERRKEIRDEGLAAAADQIVHRALERAGNRLGSRFGGKIGGVPASEQHMKMTLTASDTEFALTDAWGSNVVTIAARYDVPASTLTGFLDGYVRSLLTTQSAHSYDTFRTQLMEEFR